MEKTKKCVKCGKELPIECFGKNKNVGDGLQSWCKECFKKYRQTPIIRAKALIANYRLMDKKQLRGVGDLTPKWIVENIFTKPCVHCGESDWAKIGCNRLDNSKPHTMDNVEPCCKKCNTEQAVKSMEDSLPYSKQYSKH